jgi:Macrocin-O-methyltransferase (TylF)
MKNAEPQFNKELYRSEEAQIFDDLYSSFDSSSLSLSYKLQAFPLFVRRQDVAYFLGKYEIFKQILNTNGSIVECGVFVGGGIMTWLHCSSILEPYNHTRKIIGFDTFSGFPEIDKSDTATGKSEHLHVGGLAVPGSMKDELTHLVSIHKKNSPLSHINKVELIEGDACETIPDYVENNPHLLISLLYLDFDIYKPTKAALKHLFNRVVKGGIVAFDELNCKQYPGETIAMMEAFDLATVELKRFPFTTHISYFIK